MLSGTIFDIKRYAINDGPGIRTTVFFKGCPLSCWWCHNPESQSRKAELMYRGNRCTRCGECVNGCPRAAISLNGAVATDRSRCDDCGLCAEACYNGARELVGTKMTLAQVMGEIERDVPFFDRSGGGVTFSGGEPLVQSRFLAEVLKMCRQHEIHTVVDTCGYAAWDALDRLRSDVNLFLYDLKLIDDRRHKQYTGVSNQLILDNLQRLGAAGAKYVVRIPLIEGINQNENDLREFGEFLSRLENIVHVELMAYHDIAQAKYAALGRKYLLADARPPGEAEMSKATEYLRSFGLCVI